MTIKNQFINILHEADQKNGEAKKRILDICNNPDYTYEGKKKAVSDIAAKLSEYLEGQKDIVIKIVSAKVDEITRHANAEQERRNNDTVYQNSLAVTLQLLPSMIESTKPEDQKDRLSAFNDDPIACAVIEAKAKEILQAHGAGLDTIKILDVIPTCSTEQRKERLQKLANTMIRHLESMNVSVDDGVFRESAGNVSAHEISGGSIIIATEDYINNCNDDCTVWTGQGKSSIDPNNISNTNFPFNFKRLR